MLGAVKRKAPVANRESRLASNRSDAATPAWGIPFLWGLVIKVSRLFYKQQESEPLFYCLAVSMRRCLVPNNRPNCRNKPAARPAARPVAGGRRYRASRSRYPNLAKGPRRPCSWPVVRRRDVGRGGNLRGLGTDPARRRRPGYSPRRERRRRSGRFS